MSSLAAARADNFYNPPDWDPSKQSRNAYNNSHGALGSRARKLKSEGILIIRFEMPFPVWCEGCGHLIGKGVRFNAEKKEIGKYHSTRIWSFRMKAPCCKQEIEVNTDPKNAEYVVVSGAKRKSGASTLMTDEAAEVGPDALVVDPYKKKSQDAIGMLEVRNIDKKAADERASEILYLEEQSHQRYKDDADQNRVLRRAMRQARREEHGRRTRRQELGLAPCIELQPETYMDRARAAAVDFGGGRIDATWKQRRRRIIQQSIFSKSTSGANVKIRDASVSQSVKKRRRAKTD